MDNKEIQQPKKVTGLFEVVSNRYKDANLSKKLNIALITALLIPLVLSFVYAVVFFGNKIQEEASHKNDSDLSLTHLLYKNKVFEYEQVVANFSNDKALGLLLSLNLTNQIVADLTDRLANVDYDMIHILDKQSQVISRIHRPLFLGDTLEETAYLTSALKGNIVSGTEVLKKTFLENEGLSLEGDYNISIRAASPLYNRITNEIVGVLIITKILNNYPAFLQELSEQVGETISIYQGNSLAISSSSKADTSLKASVENIISQGNRYNQSSILQGLILGFQPLKSAQGDVIGALGVSASAKDFQLTFIYGFLAFLGIGLGGLWLALKIRRILAANILLPIHELHQGTKVLAKGDYDYKISVINTDEIGELSTAFNRMAGDLKRTYTQLEEYSHQLEDKVAQRTAELVTKNDQLEQTLDMLNPGVSQLISTSKHDLGLVSATEFINDICSYTRMNILLSEEFVGNFINQYYQESHKILAMYRGFRDKTVGDQTVASFGITKDAFARSEHHAFDAINAALGINKLLLSMSEELTAYVQTHKADVLRKLRSLGEKEEEINHISFDARTGVNTSLLDTDDDIDQLRMVMMGGLTGSDYTGQGGALIYAARLEASGTAREIHVGRNTAGIIQGFFNLEQLESVHLKGLGERERYKIVNRKYFFEQFGSHVGIKQYQKDIPIYIYQAVNSSILGYINIKEVSRITKKIPVSINYYEHCDGKCDEILARSLVLYAMSKKLKLHDQQIQNLILAYIVYKADQLHPKNFVLTERDDLLSVFAEDFQLKDLGTIRTFVSHLKDKAASGTEIDMVRLVEAYTSQLMDRTFLQENQSALLSSPNEFYQKNKDQFGNYHLENLIQLF